MARSIARFSRSRSRQRVTYAGLLALIAAGLLWFAFYATARTHLFLTTTESMQPGLYWLQPGERVERGEIAIACVPARFAQWALRFGVLKSDRRCDGVEPVIKRVVAVAGDRIRLTARGVFVNGSFELESQRRRSFRGRPIPAVATDRFQLRPNEVLLLGDFRSGSYDGRYFGATARVLGAAVLIVAL